MTIFVQGHALFNYVTSVPNRGQDGEPKTVTIGNVERGRISSQCLKRNYRVSDLFIEAFGEPGTGNTGMRTKEIPCLVFRDLMEGGFDEGAAEAWALIIGSVFGVVEGQKGEKTDLRNATLFFLSPEEKEALDRFVKTICKENRVPPAIKGKDALEKEAQKIRKEILRSASKAVDLAMFGRMFASDKSYSVDAAVQVLHAFTITPKNYEPDFGTGCDDVKDRGDSKEVRGSGHMFEQDMVAGVFYKHIVINLTQLEKTLGDPELARRACRVLMEAFFTVTPSAKKNSSAHGTTAFYGRVERGTKPPGNHALAYLNPVTGSNVLEEAPKRLRETAEKMNKIYGKRYDDMKDFSVTDENPNSLQDLLDLAGK